MKKRHQRPDPYYLRNLQEEIRLVLTFRPYKLLGYEAMPIHK